MRNIEALLSLHKPEFEYGNKNVANVALRRALALSPFRENGDRLINQAVAPIRSPQVRELKTHAETSLHSENPVEDEGLDLVRRNLLFLPNTVHLRASPFHLDHWTRDSFISTLILNNPPLEKTLLDDLANTKIDRFQVPQVIQSVLFNVLPNKDYQLPKAVIKVNGKEENQDPSKNVFDVNFKQEVSFDGSASTAFSSKIVSYFWDFDDGDSSNESPVPHQYAPPREFASPALRVRDENGFIADTYVGLRNNPNIVNEVVNTVVPESPKPVHYALYAIITVVGCLLLGFGVYLYIKKRRAWDST